MNMLKLFVAAGALALSCGAVGAASAASIADYSFENPAGVSGFLYRPTGVSGVTFTGDAGVAGGAGFDTPLDGVQNAFLQSTGDSGAQIDISVTGLIAGHVYSFSFLDDQRAGYGLNPYTVSFDGAPLGSFSPNASGWTARTTAVFTAVASSGTLSFAAPLHGYDNDAGIDAITLHGVGAAAVPEPAAWALMLVGFGGVGACLRRQRRVLVQAS
jgi:hypothetical protein